MAIRKVIPLDEEGFELLVIKMNSKLNGWKTVVNVSTDQLSNLEQLAAAYQGWRLLKAQLADTKTSITEFVRLLFEGDKNEPLPATPALTFVIPPLPAKPGIEQQLKELIEYIELQDGFTDAIGLDLGFYVETGDNLSPEELTGDFEVDDLSAYRLEIKFSLQKQDAFRLSYRTKGVSAWTELTLTSSPYILQVTPDPNGLAVTLEMKGTLIDKNQTVGNTSDTKTVVAHS
ncbi:MAG: hypothetical protein LUM44_20760 [Pyrinomonadaceae bacterium]|nr:hypothetical protein [Pyrinomonadaceae bacterium]